MHHRFWLPCFLVLSFLPCSPAWSETTLQQALAQAYQTNPELQAARAGVRATDEGVSQALSGWRPSVDAIASVGKLDESVSPPLPIGNSDPNLTPRSYGVQVTQPIFSGFRTVASTDAAENKVKAARARLIAIEENLFLKTSMAFLDIVRDQAVHDLAANNEKILQHRFDETRDRYKSGMLTQTDVSQADSRLARAHAVRIESEGALAIDRANYEHQVGEPPGQLQKPDLILDQPETADDITHVAETQNPGVIEAQFTVEEARNQIDVNKGSLLPEIDLVGSSSRGWGQDVLIPGREDQSQILLQMKMPLYRAGADYSRTREAEQTLTQHRMELENARRAAHDTAVSAWQAYITAKASIEADDAEARAAKLALNGVKEEANSGTRTTLDVLNAEQELLDSQVDLIRAQHDKNVAILEIKAAMGKLTAEELKLPVDIYSPQNHYEEVRNKWFGFSDADDEKQEEDPSSENK